MAVQIFGPSLDSAAVPEHIFFFSPIMRCNAKSNEPRFTNLLWFPSYLCGVQEFIWLIVISEVLRNRNLSEAVYVHGTSAWFSTVISHWNSHSSSDFCFELNLLEKVANFRVRRFLWLLKSVLCHWNGNTRSLSATNKRQFFRWSRGCGVLTFCAPTSKIIVSEGT